MRKEEQGFLLLELLVTLALFAILAPTLLGLLLLGSQTLATAYRQTVAINLAREALELGRGAGFCATENLVEEEVAGFSGFKREVMVTTLAGEEVAWPLKEVNVTVSWQELGRQQQVELVTWQAWR